MIICRCNEVTQNEIKTLLHKSPHATIEDIKRVTKASTSCGKCTSILKKYYQKIRNDQTNNNQLRISF